MKKPDETDKTSSHIKHEGYIMFIMPLVYILAAFLIKFFLNYNPSSDFYEENTAVTYLQCLLYFSGIGVFFFSETFLNFFRNRLKKKYPVKTFKSGDVPGYQNLNLYMLFVLDYIGLAGFIGFLLCSNLYWVTIFSIISFFSKFRFFPIDKRNFLHGESKS